MDEISSLSYINRETVPSFGGRTLRRTNIPRAGEGPRAPTNDKWENQSLQENVNIILPKSVPWQEKKCFPEAVGPPLTLFPPRKHPDGSQPHRSILPRPQARNGHHSGPLPAPQPSPRPADSAPKCLSDHGFSSCPLPCAQFRPHPLQDIWAQAPHPSIYPSR